ncbi:hypothetical protein PoB_005393300 [Plakobranchus ocellatus]|uniref:Mutator-like transposase domain-containing protein n=1 Tax=Plakobranchus ocellatus TaxID=259542 RepID=A0AAV4C6E0_9GAST|nr:hypothetical protein PoB_005393300 [Plakobranchus ocellatus]
MPRKKRRAVQLTEASAIRERRQAWTAQHEPHHQPQPEQQHHSEPEPELTVPQTLEEPRPSTSRGDTGEVFTQAAGLVRQEHIRQYHLTVEENSLLDIAVSYDGSWLTRGHKSLIGIGSVIDVLTGLIIDGYVLSLYCHICARSEAWIKRETPQRYDRWFQEYLDSDDCTVNFAKSSGMMEVRIAEVLWGRSIQRYNLRYTTIVSDGDSKSFNRLLELQPYGSNVLITKEDCINHVGKRLGAALRNLVADCSKKGITLGGRGHGCLTAETI